MYICYATSNEYCEYTGISLLSFLKNGNGQYVDKIFVLDYGIQPDNKAKLESIIREYGLAVEYIHAKIILEKLQVELGLQSFRSSMATYSRAFIDYIIPDYVDELLYIDSDTIVNADIKDIFKVDMSDKVIAGTVSLELYDGKHPVKEFPLLSGNQLYIGCGIVLYNLKLWRERNCRELIRDVCLKKSEARFADQTVINNAIPEKWLGILPTKFNYFGHTISPASEKITLHAGGWYTEEEIQDAIHNPVFIHYKGGPLVRPWFEGCKSRRTQEYLYYKSLSPWSHTPLISPKGSVQRMSVREQIEHRYAKIAIKQKYYFVERVLHLLIRLEIFLRKAS